MRMAKQRTVHCAGSALRVAARLWHKRGAQNQAVHARSYV
jgi:hypothetical protein